MANIPKSGPPPKSNRGVWSKIRKFTRNIISSEPIVKKTEKVKRKRSDISKKLHNEKNSGKIDSNAPKRLTPEQMAMGQFGSEVRGCICRWSGWWSNWYCTGSNCQNSGALCWNNHAVCSERPTDPKDKHPKHGHYGRGGRIRRFSGGGQTRGNGPNSCLDGNGNNVSC